MTCANRIVELVEYARREVEPRRELRAHLGACTGCSDRWEAERRLTVQFRLMRMQAADWSSPETQRESLLAQFALRNSARQPRRMAYRPWVWVLGAAAALVVSVYLGHIAGVHVTRAKMRPAPATRTHGVRSAQTFFYEASTDASALSSEDFVAVPYAPPLAQGEIVRVVHTDLYPAALASMGIGVNPAWSGELPADVVVGEDGVPRAVRITEAAQ